MYSIFYDNYSKNSRHSNFQNFYDLKQQKLSEKAALYTLPAKRFSTLYKDTINITNTCTQRLSIFHLVNLFKP